MRMYNALLVLFRAANIVALALMVISCVLTVAAKIRKGKLASATIVFPVFSEQHTAIKYCFWSGTVFVFLNWLLCSSSALSLSTKPNNGFYSNVNISDTSFVNPLSESLLTFAILWAVMILVCVLTEILLKCIKNTEKSNFSVLDGVKSAFGYSILYVVFSFLIA